MPGLEKGLEAAVGNAIDLKSGVGFWEYPEDIQIYGVSAATNLFGWSTSAERSGLTSTARVVRGPDVNV